MYRCNRCRKLWGESQIKSKNYPLLGESVKLCPMCMKEVEPIGNQIQEAGVKTLRRADGINAV